MSAPTLPRFLLFYSFTFLLFNYSSSSNTLLTQSLALPQSALCPYGISRPFCMIYRGSYSCKYSDFSVSTNVLPDKLLWLDDPRRPLRASASVDTSIRVGRCEHPRRSMRMTKVGSMKRKRDGVKREKKSVKRKKEGYKRGERGVRGYGRDAIPS